MIADVLGAHPAYHNGKKSATNCSLRAGQPDSQAIGITKKALSFIKANLQGLRDQGKGEENMKYYKLTDEKNQTRDGTQWGEGITHKAAGKGKELCTEDVIHVYDHPLKAVMFNPLHANFTNPHLWEVKVRKIVANDSLKVGVKSCTTMREIPLPEITIEQRGKFAIYCALEVSSDKKFIKWAKGWLNGTDRTAGAAAGAAARAARANIDFVRLIEKAIKETK